MPVFSSGFPALHVCQSMYITEPSLLSLPLSGTPVHQVMQCVYTGSPFRVLWFHEICLRFVPLLNVWAMTQKGKECKGGYVCCQVMLKKKHLRPICIQAGKPQTFQTQNHIKIDQSYPHLSIAYHLSGLWLPLCAFSPWWLPNICFPLISPV